MDQSIASIENGSQQGQIQPLHAIMAGEVMPGDREEVRDPPHRVHDEETGTPADLNAARVHPVSDQGTTTSGRVKVFAQESETPSERSTHLSHQTHPLYILGAITLGLPAVIFILLVGMNSGIQDGSFMTLVTIIVLSAAIIAALFEIKRLADQPSDADHH